MFSEPQFIVSVNNCLLPKLSENLNECETETFYLKYQNELDNKIERIFCKDIRRFPNLSSNALASVFILYNEILSPGPWTNDVSQKLAHKLNQQFQKYTHLSLCDLLSINQKHVAKQEIFDACMMKLHLKLTSDEFKKYPGQCAVYCTLIKKLQEYRVILDLLNLIPISLILVDDFEREYKLNGLISLHYILQLMKLEHFKNGNYYEVIYGSLRKSLYEKDIEITELVLQCLVKLLPILPAQVKMSKCDDTLATLLVEQSVESNLYRKAVFMRYTKQLFKIIGVDCVKWKKKTVKVFCDNLDVCVNEDVADILLTDTLQCLEEWLRHSWCVWKFEPDKKLLISVTKAFMSSEHHHKPLLGRIVETLVKLSTQEEQFQIISEFRNMLNYIKCNGDTTNSTKKDEKLDGLSKLLT